MACIYLFLFLPQGHFLLAGNRILCVHECAFATCRRALQDSESKWRNRFTLHSVGKLIRGRNRELFNVAEANLMWDGGVDSPIPQTLFLYLYI